MVEMENSGTSPGPPSPVLGGNGQGPLVKSLSHTSEEHGEGGGYFTKKDGRKKHRLMDWGGPMETGKYA